MLALALDLLASIVRSQIGRLALAVIIAGGAGYYKGFQEGDRGRLVLQARVEAATQALVASERARADAIIAESKREAEAENAEDVERERLLAEANTRISQLEAVRPKGCVISRETVRALNGRK